MARGREIHRELTSNLRGWESERRRYDSEVQRETEMIARLVNDREAIYGQLTRVYLPDLTATSVMSNLHEVQALVQDCFAKKQLKRTEIEKRIQENRSEREIRLEKFDELNGSIAAHETSQGEIENQWRATLAAQESYRSASETGRRIQARMNVFQERAKAFAEESRTKTAAYTSEPLFSYLLKVNYRTEKYQANPVTRFFDGWVAGFVNFAETRKQFDRLQALPGFIQRELDQQQNELNRVCETMKEMEVRAGEPLGLQRIREQGADLLRQKEALAKEMQALDGVFERYQGELKSLDSEKDSFHKEALRKLKDFLKGEEITELKRRALKTTGREDDSLVAQLQRIDDEIKAGQTRIKDVKRQQSECGERIAQLSRVENWFTRNNYENSRSRFTDNFDLTSLLAGFAAGHITESILTNTLRAEQSFQMPRHDDSGSGSSFGFGSGSDSFSSSGSSSSDTGSSWSSSDSFSSSGSSTTDSF